MADSNNSKKQGQPGLVKSLLFPAYADAGANENFHAESVSESDATTTVHDNRTIAPSNKPEQHQMQYNGDNKVGGYPPRPLDDSLLTQTGTETTDTAQEEDHLRFPTDPPPSPPSRRLLGEKSTSTTTRSGIRPFPTTSPRAPIATTNTSLDHSTEASSAAVSSVVGVNFLNESKEDQQEPTPVKDNRSINLDDPGVFQPRLADLDSRSDVLSDVNSTASEMGTVVGAAGRLADVQAMAAFMEKNHDASGDPLYESEDGVSDLPPAKDVPGLSLPTLGERKTQEKSRDARSSVFREKMDSVFRERGASTPPPAEGDSPSSATAMVSAAIRRLGSGVGNLSAPTTPRVVPPSPRVEDYLR